MHLGTLGEQITSASIIATEGLKHRRILRDPAVIEATIAFLASAQRSNLTRPRSSTDGV